MTSRNSESSSTSSSYSTHRSPSLSEDDISQNPEIDFKDAMIIRLHDEISTLITQLSQANFQVDMVLEDQKQYQCVLETRFSKEKESLLTRIQELEQLLNYWRGAVVSRDSKILQNQNPVDVNNWKMAYEETEKFRINSEAIEEILEQNQLKIRILEDKILNSKTSEASDVSFRIAEYLEDVKKFEKKMNSKNRGFQKILKNLKNPKTEKRAKFEVEKFMEKIREFSILETSKMEKKKKALMEKIQRSNPNFKEIEKVLEILNLAPGKSKLEEMEKKLVEANGN